MGKAHSHARITKRMATHRAGMRASYDSTETALLPLSVFVLYGLIVGTLSQALPKALPLETTNF